MPRAISIGEAMVELSPAQGGICRQGFAGDSFNTAWYLRARLGSDWQVGYFTRLGRDTFSQQFLGFAKGAGIDTDAIGIDETRKIGLYAISLDQGERSFSYWRDSSAARQLADHPEALEAALQGADLAFFSGITMAILSDQGQQNLLTALKQVRAAGCLVAFDPNIRPQLWRDHDRLRAMISAAAGVSDIVLPGYEDEAAWFGDADPAQTCARYAGLGASEIVVKNGGADLTFWQASAAAQGPRHMRLDPVTPVDTTGAGDSFNGAYLAARLQGVAVEEAATQAHALAAKVVRHHGALLPMPEAVG
ncbi:sugar kinase [Xinfangfangia sp. D13-10-4-6]|uniref:sugar kinase n=1 Tax=Pseudogemmobacter hezensis TaxID=2737662 RepID=UPI0015568291|nr:sugar kinase [Pseudogemmobacter hezensis]NPD16479.1 sugar kinase [Pseudogemmobacter hezensis]